MKKDSLLLFVISVHFVAHDRAIKYSYSIGILCHLIHSFSGHFIYPMNRSMR